MMFDTNLANSSLCRDCWQQVQTQTWQTSPDSPPSTSLLALQGRSSRRSQPILRTLRCSRLDLLNLTLLRVELQGVEALARSLTPDKLSALRSGSGLGGLRRTSLEPPGGPRRPSLEPTVRRPASNQFGHSPFASLNSSPIRRLSNHRRSSR